jgi:rhodanese-related sulfurtransferase
LVQGASQRFPEVDEAIQKQSAASAKAVAYRAGVGRVRMDELREWLKDATRTTYFLDVRTPEEFTAGHLMGAQSAPGGQLVQETDHAAPVRGARIVLCDNDGVRANMSASWLAQMGWSVFVLEGLNAQDFAHTDIAAPLLPDTEVPLTKATPAQVKAWLADRNSHTVLLDFSTSAQFVKGHIQNAWWVLRSELKQSLIAAHKGHRYVLTCHNGNASRYAAHDVKAFSKAGVEVVWLEGGNTAWAAAGNTLQTGDRQMAVERIDRYRRPYEGTDNAAAAMQAYLDWEFGLVEQLGRDGTHHFRVI